MKKLFKISVLAIALCTMLSACTSWLEEDSRSSIIAGEYYKTADEAQAAVIGIYHYVKSPFNKYGFDQVPYAMLELVSGVYNNQAQWPFAADYIDLKYDSSSPDFLNWWEESYKGIEAANLAIAHVPGTKMNETSRNNLVAEARFLRAYYYYNLVNIFGDIPMKVSPTSEPEDGKLTKTSVKDIYEKVIVPDLQFAELQQLNATTQGNGRVSAAAVKTLLAKVYLSMAGTLNQADKYTLAKEKAYDVIRDQKHSLFQSDNTNSWFKKLNNPAFDNKEEHIWMANFAIDHQNTGIPVYFLPKESNFTGNIQYGGFYPTGGFMDSYDAADLRGKHNFGFFYNSITVAGTTHSFPWAVHKFFDPGIIENTPKSGKNFPILRYADLLLIYAEAQNEADGSANAEAYKALNDIRKRAGLNDISGLNKDNFRAEVWKQRYWELCAEGKIWFDIVRTKRIFDTATKTFKEAVGHTMPSGAVFKESNLKFPIPAREVQINPMLAD